jgi:hypothetical protein
MNTARAIITLAAALLTSLAAHASKPTEPRSAWAPVAIGLHIGSHHVDAAPAGHPAWNDRNPGVYARWASGLVVGTLYNSERRQSAYAAYMLESPRWHGLSASVMVGAITGYAKPIKALASASAALDLSDHATLRLSYLPKANPKSSAVVHLSAEWRF